MSFFGFVPFCILEHGIDGFQHLVHDAFFFSGNVFFLTLESWPFKIEMSTYYRFDAPSTSRLKGEAVHDTRHITCVGRDDVC